MCVGQVSSVQLPLTDVVTTSAEAVGEVLVVVDGHLPEVQGLQIRPGLPCVVLFQVIDVGD